MWWSEVGKRRSRTRTLIILGSFKLDQFSSSRANLFALQSSQRHGANGSSTTCAGIEDGNALDHLAHGKCDAFLKASCRIRKGPREHYAAAACQQVLAAVEVVSDRRTQH